MKERQFSQVMFGINAASSLYAGLLLISVEVLLEQNF